MIKDITPETLEAEVDISRCALYEVNSAKLSQDNYKVKVKDLVHMIARLSQVKADVEKAQKELTNKLNVFLDRA